MKRGKVDKQGDSGESMVASYRYLEVSNPGLQIAFLYVGGVLIYLQDTLSNSEFLVDTGASRSVFLHHSSAAPMGPCLLMADGRPTKV